jgi:isoquinoline 1-oxidoreductase alpha subunit
MMQFVLNGRTVDLPAAYADDPLLYVLRDHFELNGPKFGCGAGACGACMVHVDGEARRSCQLTARDVAGHDVTSLEGLGAGRPGGLHPLQQAWIDHLVPQCGYCQNGQIMTAAALLAGNPTIGSDEIAAEMDRVLCRCGTQMRIRAAISAARDVMRRGA